MFEFMNLNNFVVVPLFNEYMHAKQTIYLVIQVSLLSQIYKQKLYNLKSVNMINTRTSPNPANPQRTNAYQPAAFQPGFPQFYTITAQSRQEQNKINNGLSWRQITSMPVVKVSSYTCEPVQLCNDKTGTLFKVQLQNILKSVIDIRNLDIGQAAYAVREILLGIQTLCIKFNCQFDPSKGFYGINSKGQVKVWFSNNFISQSNIPVGKSISFSVRNINSVIENLFEVLSHTLKHTHKATFEEIGKRLFMEDNLTFAESQNKFRKLCVQFKIVVPNSIVLFADNRRRVPSGEKKFKRPTPILKEYGIFTGRNQVPHFIHGNTQKLINRNQNAFNSPNGSSCKNVQFISNKPKVNWSYANSAKNQQSMVNRITNRDPFKKMQTVCNSINRASFASSRNNSGKKQSFFCRTVPIKMDSQKKNSEQHRFLGKDLPREQVHIKQFNPLQEQEQILQVSRHIQSYRGDTNLIENSGVNTLKSINTAETKNQDQSKLSFEAGSYVFQSFNAKKSNATTKISDNTQRGKDSIQQFKDKVYNFNRLQQMIDNSKTVVDSIMIPSPLESRKTPESRTTYNFGGLIPIQIGNQVQIDGKEAESLQASRDWDQKQQNIIKQIKKSRIDFDLLGGIDLMAKFFTTDAKDLKQSVWCGQEKKAQHLHIKLEKLGNFGRQICSSFVPNE